MEELGPLTWPEGNGWITRRLLERVGENVRTGQMVNKIIQSNRGVTVLAGDTEYRADFVIFAAPTFLAPYLIDGFPKPRNFVYSPWLTANLTLERLPESRGAEPTWDTVFMDSPTLGYVDATHQSVRTFGQRTVWTFYWALADGTPAQNRQFLLEKDWNYWKEAILQDLERVHTDIRRCVSRMDVMRMGHAMIRPSIGAILSEDRANLKRKHGRVVFANSDLSGISIFEEAQYHGIDAAQIVLGHVSGHPS
jgi:glycine/D-amino acid oxidase-like deaminating enzyme